MASDNGAVLKTIADMLGNGLETQVEPFPETDKEFSDILIQLRQLDAEGFEGQAGYRRVSGSSVRAGKTAVPGMHVLSRASEMVRFA